jgi:prephenate dehydrogenase
MKELNADINESLEFSSPIYKLRMDMVGRILNQDAGMYADIGILNKKTRKTIKAYVDSAMKLQKIIDTNDREAFIRYFKSAQEYLRHR